MINENLELKPYRSKTNSDSNSEQYHEIDQNALVQETTFSVQTSWKQINSYDFFTQHEVNVKERKGKSKGKKKKDRFNKSLDIMDIIKSELAPSVTLIHENVIQLENYNKEIISFYRKNTNLKDLIQWKNTDVEQGWNFKSHFTKLSPIFPKILENTLIKDYPVNVHYTEPIMFDDLVDDYPVADDLIQTQKFLDFEIQNIKFRHHHTFSLETLLLVKMVEYYNEYLKYQKLLKEIYRNVKVSRDTRNNLRLQLLKITSNKDKVRFDKTLLKYTEKLFYYKGLYIDKLTGLKEITHNLLSLWFDVEMVREKTKRIDVNYYLKINKIVISYDDYEKQWNNVFETEYIDMLDKIEYEYARAYIEYKETKNRSYDNSLNKTTTNKPKLRIDEAKIKAATEDLVDKLLERQKVDIILKSNKGTMKELSRAVQVLIAHDYYFKVFVDDVFVCASEIYTCKDPMFNLVASETFSVQMLPCNKAIQIVLYENDTNVSSIQVNIEQIKKNISHAECTPRVFTYDLDVYPDNKSVGSGYGIKEIAAENKVRLKSGNIFKGKLFTACEVNIRMGWNEKINENTLVALSDSIQVGRKIKRYLHGIEKPDINNLIWIINEIYERNIESDESIVNALQAICKAKVINDDTFPLEDKNDDGVRIKLLHLRNNGGFLNIENKLVPLMSSQISTEQLNSLLNEPIIHIRSFDDDKDTDPIDLQRYLAVKYVQGLNDKLQKTVNEFLLQKTYKDVVKDFKDLSLRGLLSNRTNLLSLSVSYFVMRQQLMKECLTKEHEIQVTVLRAFNLPDRATDKSLENEDEDSDRIAGFKLRPLRPFVKLSYHGVSAQSAPGIGCFPTWNQTIKIRTKFHPFSSIHVNVYDECKVNLRTVDAAQPSSGATVQYQRCSRWLGTLHVPIATALAVGTLRGTFKLTSPPLLLGYEKPTAHEAKTLIPEVNQMLRKDVTFITLSISTSLSHLSGVQAYSQPVPTASGGGRTVKHLNAQLSQFLNVFPSRSVRLTYVDSTGRNKCVTDFLRPIPLPDFVCSPKNPGATGSASSRSSGVSRSSSSKSGRRNEMERNLHVQEGGAPNITNMDSPDWRRDDERFMKMINFCIRYVSLIPTYEVTEAQVVTLTGLELLKVAYGSPVDHTILLASYLLGVGAKCWIVTGLALPRGATAHLLLQYDTIRRRYATVGDRAWRARGRLSAGDGRAWHVVDAASGERYALRDAACPLKTAVYAHDDENIWLNVQSSIDCGSVSFDFTKSSDWQRVFATPRVIQKPPVSAAGLYSAPCDVERLREALESKIRCKVQKWRPRVKTVWNRYCSTLLRETLPQWEYWSFNSTDPKPAPGHRLKEFMVAYKMFGFPLNMHYVNTRSVVANVKATAVHANEDSNVEFALATQVFAYPNNVLSVWIYIANVTRI